MGESPETKPFKRVVTVIILLVIGLIAIAAMKVVPPMVFEQRLTDGIEAIMKQPADVGDAHIAFDLKSGYANNVVVHNPEIYKGTVFLEIPRLTFELAPDNGGNTSPRFKHITLHDPVLHLETLGDTSNLKDMIEHMLEPGGEPAPPVIIDTIRVENGTISAVFEHGDGKPIISEFPLDHFDDLEGTANQIAGQVAVQLQKKMDAQVKEAARDINEGFIQAIKKMFGRDE